MRKPQNIALVIPTRLPVNGEIIKGIAEYENANCDWIMFLDDQAKGSSDYDWLFRRDWDGVICREGALGLAEECDSRGVPFVDIEGTCRGNGVSSVRYNDVAVGHLGAEYLMDLGFQSFGFFGYQSEWWSLLRYEGFVEALSLTGKDCVEYLSDYSGSLDPWLELWEMPNIKHWLRRLPTPVGIFACNDLRALQLVSALREEGILIPDRVSVLGAGNDLIRTKLSHPQVSSVAVDPHKLGYEAASSLDRILKGGRVRGETLIDPLEVIVRRSTDVLAIPDKTVSEAMRIVVGEACNGLTVDELAKRVNVSRSQLDRKFVKFVQRSPKAAIRLQQIKQIKMLLRDTSKTLAEIAELVSIEHPEYVSVLFKRMEGVSPREYRDRFNRS